VTLTRAITVESITDAPASEPFLRRPGLLERAIATVMLFVFAFSLPTEWFVRVSNSSAGTVEGGSPITTLVFLSFLGVVWLGFNGNWHIAMAAAGREPLLVALVGLAGLSTAWSVSLGETLAASIVLFITYIVGLYFASRFRLEEMLFLAGIALTVGLFANYAFIFVFQEFGLDNINVGTEGGSKWSGVFVTKNELGRIASLSFIVFGFLARIRRSFLLWPILALLALIQVVASDSATSLGATGGIILLLVVFLGFRGRKTFYGATAVAMISVFVTLTVLAATNLVVATGLLGKNSTFTGRLPLWQNSFTYGIAERRWFGHGWLAFWSQERLSFDVKIRSNFDVPHAHNAFIDAWLYIGPLGAALLLAIYIRGLVWGARNIRAVPTAVGLVPIIIISYSLIFSLTEAGVIRRDISFIFFVVACVTAAKNKGVRRPFVPAKDHGSERSARTNLSV
jgi:exopolysaccharide production protein ExoQ